MAVGPTFQMISLLIGLAALLDLQSGMVGADDVGTNFFLKASKSVPRIGRRGLDDNYFMKASKSVPRIGRRGFDTPLPGKLLPEKRYFSERYFGGNAQPAWGSIDGSLKELSGVMQGDEPYREFEPFPDAYWQQMKKNGELEETRQQPAYQR